LEFIDDHDEANIDACIKGRGRKRQVFKSLHSVGEFEFAKRFPNTSADSPLHLQDIADFRTSIATQPDKRDSRVGEAGCINVRLRQTNRAAQSRADNIDEAETTDRSEQNFRFDILHFHPTVAKRVAGRSLKVIEKRTLRERLTGATEKGRADNREYY
jgi:hypothetical protein